MHGEASPNRGLRRVGVDAGLAAGQHGEARRQPDQAAQLGLACPGGPSRSVVHGLSRRGQQRLKTAADQAVGVGQLLSAIEGA
jgi:hypothetical protein